MKYISYLAVLSLMWAAHVGTAQITIDFSAEQGFSDGPLNGQSGTGDRWNENNAGAFTVDAAAGTVTFDSSSDNWSSAIYTRGLAVGDVTIFVIEFKLTAGTATPRSDTMLTRVDFLGGDGNAFAAFRQRGGGSNQFDLLSGNNLGSGRDAQSSRNFSGESMGLKVNRSGSGFSEATSNKLRLVVVHRRTGENNQFTTAVVLQDAESNEDIQRVVHEWQATENWAQEEGKRFRISSGNMNQSIGDGGATSISIDSIRLGVANE